jgi:hypothetical protein
MKRSTACAALILGLCLVLVHNLTRPFMGHSEGANSDLNEVVKERLAYKPS